MTRLTFSLLGTAVLALCTVACSGGQTSCTQPVLQNYPTPLLIQPKPNSSDVSPTTTALEIQTTSSAIAGTFSLTAANGAKVTAGTPTLESKKSASVYVWSVSIGTLSAATTYTLVWTLEYPGGCQTPPVTKNNTIASFTTASS